MVSTSTDTRWLLPELENAPVHYEDGAAGMDLLTFAVSSRGIGPSSSTFVT